jgi:hypothetical protein
LLNGHLRISQRWLLPYVAALCALPAATRAMQQAAVRGPVETAEECAVREVSRARLVVEDGRELYVEPVAFAASGGEMLLVGTPNYLWKRQTPAGPVLAVAADSVFGAVIGQDGRARIVPSPVDAKRVAGARALGRSDGGWDVVFAELAERNTSLGDQPVSARLWYGIFDGSKWSSLEQIPLPTGALARLANPSPIVRRLDTLFWVIRLQTRGGDTELAVYQRNGGRSSSELVRTDFAAYASLGASDTLGVVLLVVRGDTAQPMRENAIFFFARQPRWELVRRVDGVGEEPVHMPSIDLSSPGALTWLAPVPTADGGRQEARVMLGRLEAEDGQLFTIDSSVTHVTPAVQLRGGIRVWVTEHLSSSDQTRELRFVGHSGRSPVILGRAASPFLGPFTAASPAPSQIVIAGPLAEGVTTNPAVVTLLIRVRVDCPARPRRPR